MIQTRAADVETATARQRVADFVALTKPRLVVMVLITTLAGFYLGSDGVPHLDLLLSTLIGTALAAGGTLALNQYIERDVDALMARTRTRPLPQGRILPKEALVFGAVLTLAGPAYLAVAVNAATALVIVAISVSYLFLYTPMKRTTPLCTIVGAIPGALPPMAGWVAARGTFGIEAWILFAILFLWQLPHSLAIAQLYRDEYAAAGIRLLPVVDPDGGSTARQVVANTLALFAVGLLPSVVGLAGPIYFVAALLLGGTFLAYSVWFARSGSADSARQLLFASLLYLPALLIIMAVDKLPLGAFGG